MLQRFPWLLQRGIRFKYTQTFHIRRCASRDNMDIKAMPSFSLLMGNRRPFNRLPDLERRLAGSHEGMGDGLWPAFFNKDRILFKKKNHHSCLQQDVPCLEFWWGFFNMEYLYKTNIALWLIFVRPVLSSVGSATHTSDVGGETSWCIQPRHNIPQSWVGGTGNC